MKIPKITLERVNQLVTYDPITGEVRWKVSQGKSKTGNLAGSTQHGYGKLTIDKEQIKLHRLVWFIHHKEWPKGQIDHIDGNKLNNKISNLRDVPMSINMQNRYAIRRNASDMPQGVTKTKHGKFLANIRIGVFNSAEEASEAYMQVKKIIHEGCSHLS